MNPLMFLVNSLIQRNPNIANNPRNQELLKVIQNGDSKKGEEIARNLCQTYGETPEAVTQKAAQYFGIGGNNYGR